MVTVATLFSFVSALIGGLITFTAAILLRPDRQTSTGAGVKQIIVLFFKTFVLPSFVLFFIFTPLAFLVTRASDSHVAMSSQITPEPAQHQAPQEIIVIVATLPPPISTEVIQPTSIPTELPTPSFIPIIPTPSPAGVMSACVPTSVPEVTIIGHHEVRSAETVYCIARTYGVSPSDIIKVNNLFPPNLIHRGLNLNIPAVQWSLIPPGKMCAPQFDSPYTNLSCGTIPQD